MFDTSAFMPHAHCFLWRPGILWTHVLSDAVIGLAYFSIPLAMLYYKIKARHTGKLMNAIIWMFMAFIVLCGSTHFVQIWTMWDPVYYLEGTLKAMTALVSIGVAAALWPLMPKALTIPSPEELEHANDKLDRLNRNLASEIEQATGALLQKARALESSNEELRRSNADLDDFAYVASHDLRSPLRGIDNLAKWIEEDCLEVLPESSREDLQTLRGRVKRMENLLEGLLLYSRVGRAEQEIASVDLEQLVLGLGQFLDKPADFRITTSGDLPTLTTQVAPLETVLRNLVGNAIKHHDHEDGQVTVSCKDAGDFYRISVSDDGPGIPEEHHDTIFGLFKTLKPRDEVEGSGLGLAIVKKTIEHAGGSLEVRNIGSGRRGATFDFLWPKEMEQSSAA